MSSLSRAVEVERLNLLPLFPEKKDAYAMIIDHLFTEQECQDMIERTEVIGYEEALVGAQQLRVESQRNNYRVILDNQDLAAEIYRRVHPYLPKKWLGHNLSRVNERLRFLKYKPGEYFKPHNDGIYVNETSTEQTYITIHLYLNDVKEGHGGETTFTTAPLGYGRHLLEQKRLKETDPTQNPIQHVSVRPVTGRALVFEHHLKHEGSTLLQGVKYTLRAEALYTLNGDKPNRAPRWNLTFPHPQYEV
ncbi:MAG: hypothetical protein Sylvanvirus4_4 [Sylvanvirus sp.]|uniref:Fe2OG dioxygenase domain-containing protein n=1 Tax=Sylvanvirus sp. TaxID=2487774 RepID=A0A3G5AHF3_9VIRU|nr:MAG: hypothetical protein Sylvanvirus4_4 [Sylvanvirus sp.]